VGGAEAFRAYFQGPPAWTSAEGGTPSTANSTTWHLRWLSYQRDAIRDPGSSIWQRVEGVNFDRRDVAERLVKAVAVEPIDVPDDGEIEL
jgi:hypothetical protein